MMMMGMMMMGFVAGGPGLGGEDVYVCPSVPCAVWYGRCFD